MTSDNSGTNNTTDSDELKMQHALASLLLNLGEVDKPLDGPRATDEEIAMLAEPDAEIRLGKLRYDQLLAQISSDEKLYRSWLMLAESRELDGDFQPEANVAEVTAPLSGHQKHLAQEQSSRPFAAVLLDWWQSLFQPGWSFASAAGFAGVGFLAAYVTVGQLHRDEAATHSGHDIPFRANRETSGDISQLNRDFEIANYLQCEPVVTAEREITICYSATAGRQHWFAIENAQLSALPAPIQADKIVSLRSVDSLLLTEYVEGNHFKLALDSIDRDEEAIRFNRVYQDVLSEGFFDSIQLDSTMLRYVKKVEGSAAKVIEYPIE